MIFARKENKRKSCLLFSLVFAGFQKELSAETLLFQREGRAGYSWENYRTKLDISALKKDSFQCHYFDILGAEFFHTPGVFIESPNRAMKRITNEHTNCFDFFNVISD